MLIRGINGYIYAARDHRSYNKLFQYSNATELKAHWTN
jgi:hypothetical protein